jgi:ADP-heptose:LPS heptosyltransferase
MPSALKKEFPELDFGKLAQYYEKGNGIEGEFILSWDDIENFYQELEHENKREILKLIKQMREYGFDKTLRAGQSLYTMILSRSRRHGLRDNQDSISFSFDYIKSKMEVRTRQGQKFEFSKIEYNDTIDKLLRTIELEEID